MDAANERKWDRAAARFDWMAGLGPEKRWGAIKRDLFRRMGPGRVLFVAMGTGLDIQHFPPRREIVGIDVSSRMLAKARARAERYDGRLELLQMDALELSFPDASFDQVFTSCTFCSVPRPVEGLRELYRVLRPSGELFMFEHTGSRHFPFNVMLDVATPIARRGGPDLNRPTVANVERAGFEVLEVHHHFLDVVKTIRAVKPRSPGLSDRPIENS